jgi:hypothetical protein
MSALKAEILAQIKALPEGGILSAKEFLHVGSRAAIDQNLSRLAKEGKLLRVARGIYAMPVTTRFGTHAPSPEMVIENFSQMNSEVVVIHGAVAANQLGLSQQVPMRQVYLTSGKSRTLKIGKSVVVLKKAPGWMLRFASSEEGNAIRAMAWMGKGSAGISASAIHKKLEQSKWKSLTKARSSMPSWMAKAIGEEMVNA